MASPASDDARFEKLKAQLNNSKLSEEEKRQMFRLYSKVSRLSRADWGVTAEIPTERSGKARSELGAQVRLVRNKPTPPEQ